MTISPSTRQQLFEETAEGQAVIRLQQVRRAPAPAAEARPVNRVGTWTAEEHQRFLDGLNKFPSGPWNRIAKYVGTRTRRQVMTHAQKYRHRLQRRSHRVSPRAAQAGPEPVAVTVLSVVVSPMQSGNALTADATGEMWDVISLPDAFVRESEGALGLSPLPDLGFFAELLNIPFFDTFDMTQPGADVEPLQLSED